MWVNGEIPETSKLVRDISTNLGISKEVYMGRRSDSVDDFISAVLTATDMVLRKMATVLVVVAALKYILVGETGI